ncbi:MAG: hypothetical protein LBP33_03495 [Candidatus Adiutrix sp.]|jgi:hypothetical protein|nr:hypothetical protein [Candidatus Adiutrix sp.]
MRMNKYHISVLLILIAIIGCHFWPQSPSPEVPPSVESSLPASGLKPAKVNEPFKTWYLGDIAVDIPNKSMALDGLLKFNIHPDAENSNITIGLGEISADEAKNKDYRLTSSEPLSRAGSQVFSWEPAAKKTEDIGAIIGSPAGLSMFYGPDKVEQDRWALGMDVRIKEDYGYLEFVFTELVFEPLSSEQLEMVFSQKKDMFLSWISGFLKAYNWTGHNQKPGHKQLATRLGIINVEETLLISNISVMAFFASIDGAHRPTDRITIVLDRLFYAGLCPGNENLTDAIYKSPGNGNIGIYKEWAMSVDSAIYGSICVTMMTIASTGGNDHEAQSYIMGLSNAILKSVRSAIK